MGGLEAPLHRPVFVFLKVNRNARNGYVLKLNANKFGYVCVTLDYYSRKVHSLVAAAFLGPRPKECDANHIDGCKANNRVDNLEYITRKEHIRHSMRLGLHDRGTKLTEADIPTIRRLAKTHSLNAIARMYNVTGPCISLVVKRETWKHVPD